MTQNGDFWRRWPQVLACGALAVLLGSCGSGADPAEAVDAESPDSAPVTPVDAAVTTDVERPTVASIGSLDPVGDTYLGNIYSDAVSTDPDWLSLWNQVTAENAGKWGEVEFPKDSMNWDTLDASYAFAKENGLPYKFHTLVWGQQQPPWMDDLTAPEQLAEIEEWYDLVAERYPDLDEIDVVNEPLHHPPTYTEALGGAGETGWDWVITSYEMARERFPDAVLLINDFNIVGDTGATSQYLELVDLLVERDLLDGIGIQAHFLETAPLERVEANLDRLAERQLPIFVSELDVDVADDLEHGKRFAELFTVFWEHPSVDGVTLWGYREGLIWRPDAFLVSRAVEERPALTWLRCYVAAQSDCLIPEPPPPPRIPDRGRVRLHVETADSAIGAEAGTEAVVIASDRAELRFDDVTLTPLQEFVTIHHSGAGSEVTVTITTGGPDGEEIASVTLDQKDGDRLRTEGTMTPVDGEFTVWVIVDGGVGVEIEHIDLRSR